MTGQDVVIDLSTLYQGTAKLDQLVEYEQRVIERISGGESIVITGAAPVWLYLRIAHALHGKAKRLTYRSPVTGDVRVFDHDPY